MTDLQPGPPVAHVPLEVVADGDAGAAAERALARSGAARTAVWVGAATDPAIEEFRAEIGRAR